MDPRGFEPSPATGQRATEPRPRRRPSETLLRLAWAIPWVVVGIAIISLGGLVLVAAMIVFACVGLLELFKMTERARPLAVPAFAAAAGLIVAAHFGSSFQILIVWVAIFPLMFGFAAARDSRVAITTSIAVTVFGIAWIAIPFAHAVLLRDLPLHGAALLFDVVLATVLTDTCAYFGGRLFGRNPLAPSLSPNKTVEGLVVGLIGGTMTFWFAGLYQDWLSGVDALILGATVAALAPVGDLFESMVKRDLGVKDTGRLFGPHGGVLDRLDALMFTVVAAYYVSVALLY
jgi:phosphatidate cytidylyltransferase